MEYVRLNEDRGKIDLGWLKSHHSFSFGHYYDPKHMGVSVLRVINDDSVVGGAGFDTHGHADMEIISYVLEGTIEHKDSMGNQFTVPAGEIQRMSAGTGITHSEYNASATEPLKFLQIWIQPNKKGLKPSYQQAAIPQKGALTPLVTADERENSLHINQDIYLYRLQLKAGESYDFTVNERKAYLHVIDGEVDVKEKTLNNGDAISFTDTEEFSVKAGNNGVTALWFDLP